MHYYDYYDIILQLKRAVRWYARGTKNAYDRRRKYMDILTAITKEYKRENIPEFNVGDNVRVHIKIREGSRERIQVFDGFVLKKQHGGINER